MSMREQFEKEYPVPEGCHYLVTANRYSFASPDVYYPIRELQDQNIAWEAWQASRAAIVLPDFGDVEMFPESIELAVKQAIGDP